MHIVIEKPAVVEFQVADVQVENCLCQRFSGTGARRVGDISDAIFSYSYMHVGLVNNHAIQRDFASPPGIDAQTSVHFLGGKEGFGASGFQTVNFEAF